MEWSKSSVGYGRKLVNSGLEGARAGQSQFLREESLAESLNESSPQALLPAIFGVCAGVLLGTCAGNGRRSAARTVAYGVLGGAIGFGAGVIWQNREFTEHVVSEAWKSINRTRDEHWLENNPIDYA